MKRLVAVIWIFVLLSCNNTKESIKTNGIVVDINKGEMRNFTFGYNTANTFKYSPNQEQELFDAIEKIAPQTLRFPGGTIANFYHPGEKNYGFRASDTLSIKGNVSKHIKKLMSEDQNTEGSNYLDQCIALCKKTNSSVLLVANVLNGNIEELEFMINSFQKNQIKIEGIELGNELYLKAYKDRVPAAKEYIALCTPFAAFINTNHPEIPISVTIESKGDDNLESSGSWNNVVSKESFFDAVSFHYYFRAGSCENTNESDASNCYLQNVIEEYKDNFEPTITKLNQLFPNKQIWLTEFNLFEPGKNIGGTNVHGLLLLNLSLRMSNNSLLDKVILHNLAGIDKVFSTITISHNTIVKNPLHAAFSNVSPRLKSYYPVSIEKEISIEQNTFFFTDKNHKSAYRIVINTKAEGLKISEPLFINKSDTLSIQNETSTILQSETNTGTAYKTIESSSKTQELQGYSILITKYIFN